MCWHSSCHMAIAPSLAVLILLSHQNIDPWQSKRCFPGSHRVSWGDKSKTVKEGEALLPLVWLSKVGEGSKRGHSGFSLAAWTVWRAWPQTGGQLWSISWVWAGGSHTWKAEEKLSPAPPLDTSFWTHQRAERREDPQRPCRKFVSLFLKSFWPWSICQSPSKCLWSLELG